MSVLVILIPVSLVGIVGLVWALRRMESERFVKVQRGELFVGKNHLALSVISRIEIAPLYDVPPADDLWMFEGTKDEKVSFFNRDPGAAAALAKLDTELPELDSKQALQKARDESFFEQPVTVWSRQPHET